MASAQQDAHMTHHSFNNMYFNPAYAGIEQAPNFKMLYRNQWLGYQNSFQDLGDNNGAGNSMFLTADMPILPMDGGVGLSFLRDDFRSMRMTTVSLAVSKHVVIEKGKLSIGLQGYYGGLTPLSDWRPPDGIESIPNDNAIPKPGQNNSMMDMSAGLWYQSDYKNINKGFYVGLSMTRLTETDFPSTWHTRDINNNIIDDNGGSARHMYLSGGYNIEAGYDLVITPNLLYKTDFGSAQSLNTTGQTKTKRSHSFELGAKALYQETYWGGLNFRQGDNIAILLGASFMDRKQLKVGYALDLVAIGTAAKTFTSHELMAAYYLPKMVRVPKPIIRTPRYKF